MAELLQHVADIAFCACEQVGALIAAKSASIAGWEAEVLALLGDHPLRNSSLAAWEVSLVIGLQVLVVMAAATSGRRLIKSLVTKAEEVGQLTRALASCLAALLHAFSP